MEPSESARKTRAIVFSDIQGYSKLMGENESLAMRLLEEHNAICVPLIKQSGGAILKYIGDAILSSYESASDAVHCGIAIQRALALRNAGRPKRQQIVVRIGIHIGDVVFKDGDVFGDGVNIAARIEPLAEPGGIAISQTVFDMIKARPEIQTISLGAKDLKNIKDAVNIYKVLIEAGEARPGVSLRKPLMIAAGLAAVLAAGAAGIWFWRSRPVWNKPPILSKATMTLAQATAPSSAVDPARAAGLNRTACEMGDGGACQKLGWSYHMGDGVAKDDALAAKMLGKGCDMGNSGACDNLGGLYRDGQGIAKDEPRAVALFLKSCGPDHNFPGGCYDLAKMYDGGLGVAKDQAKAVPLFRKVGELFSVNCEMGNNYACYVVGELYRNGQGVAPDAVKAVAYYVKSCDMGNRGGCGRLGTSYKDGEGVAKDDARAAEFFRKACDMGDRGFCGVLADLYLNGQGVAKDEAKAMELYRKSCDMAAGFSCRKLGWMYQTGQGTAVDEASAVQYYRKGCDAGDREGCGKLGWMYQNGRGIGKDEAMGARLFQQACGMGDSAGCENLKRLRPS